VKLKTLKRKGTCRIAVSGEATIYGVGEAMPVFRKALAESQRVEVDLSRVSEMDSAFCQLLLAARRQGEQDGTPVEIVAQSDVSEEMMIYLSALSPKRSVLKAAYGDPHDGS